MKNKNILLRALLTGMLCITSLTIFTGCIDKKDGDGMVNGRTADGELPENGDAEPVPIKANKAGKPEIKDQFHYRGTGTAGRTGDYSKTGKERRDRRTESREVSGSFPSEHGRNPSELWSGLSWRSG